ncbi:cupin domain-containing protein [Mycobacterium syngnathidarum]
MTSEARHARRVPPSPAPAGHVKPVITRAGQESQDTANSGGAIRVSGVSIQHTPATKIWYGKVHNDPGYRSLPHHHGEAETGGYVMQGRGRIYFGEDYSEYYDMNAGDWVFVPPFMPHIECNLSHSEALVWLTARTPDNIVVNLEDVPDAQLRNWLDRD